MMLLLLLLLLNISREIFGIRCIYYEEPLEFKLNEFNYDEFKKQVQIKDYKDDNVDMCRVEIYLDYETNELVISLGDSFEPSELDDREARLDFLIIFTENNTEVEYFNILEYACYDQHLCNDLFIINHINWLVHVNYTSFETQLRSLLVNNINPTEYCYVDNVKLSACSSGICLGKYSTDHNNYLFECHQNAESLIEVHITTNMVIIERISDKTNVAEEKIIRYTCKFNQCNNQILTDKLVNIVQQHYQLSEMRDALLAPYRTNEITTSTITTSTDKTTSLLTQKQTSTKKQESLSSNGIRTVNILYNIKLNISIYFIFTSLIIYF